MKCPKCGVEGGGPGGVQLLIDAYVYYDVNARCPQRNAFYRGRR